MWLIDGPLVCITPCSRVVLERLIITQLGKKFPAFCGTLRLITEPTTG